MPSALKEVGSAHVRERQQVVLDHVLTSTHSSYHPAKPPFSVSWATSRYRQRLKQLVPEQQRQKILHPLFAQHDQFGNTASGGSIDSTMLFNALAEVRSCANGFSMTTCRRLIPRRVPVYASVPAGRPA